MPAVRRDKKGKKPSTNSSLHDPTSLFTVDVEGDVSARNRLAAAYTSGRSEEEHAAAGRLRKGTKAPRLLRSDEILNQRSREPGLVPRRAASAVAGSAGGKRKREVPKNLQRKLEGLVKRKERAGRGLLDVGREEEVRDAKEVSEAVGKSGEYDVWQIAEEEKRKEELMDGDAKELIVIAGKTKFRTPSTLNRHPDIQPSQLPPAIPLPHPGTSYNPSQESHQTLLRAALSEAEKEEEADRDAREFREKIERVAREEKAKGRRDNWEIFEEEVGSGESGDEGEATGDQVAGEEGGVVKKKVPTRKTKQQRSRKARALEEARIHAERQLKKSQHKALSSIEPLSAELASTTEIDPSAPPKHLSHLPLATQGLANTYLGPTRIPAARTVYQLGEELSMEGLRGLRRLESNGWREWLGSEWRRGRVQVERKNVLGGGGLSKLKGVGRRGMVRRGAWKVVEKHAWKNFEKGS